jgi:hypothetical protein
MCSQQIHRTDLGLGQVSPAPNRTYVGRAEMSAIPDPGSAFQGQPGGRVTRRNGRSANYTEMESFPVTR